MLHLKIYSILYYRIDGTDWAAATNLAYNPDRPLVIQAARDNQLNENNIYAIRFGEINQNNGWPPIWEDYQLSDIQVKP